MSKLGVRKWGDALVVARLDREFGAKAIRQMKRETTPLVAWCSKNQLEGPRVQDTAEKQCGIKGSLP